MKVSLSDQEALEDGLRAAELAERHGISSGAPVRTKEGKLTVMVEGRHGRSQPFALLRFVPGERLQASEPNAASIHGNLLGRIHTILLHEFVKKCSFRVANNVTIGSDTNKNAKTLAFSRHELDGT